MEYSPVRYSTEDLPSVMGRRVERSMVGSSEVAREVMCGVFMCSIATWSMELNIPFVL